MDSIETLHELGELVDKLADAKKKMREVRQVDVSLFDVLARRVNGIMLEIYAVMDGLEEGMVQQRFDSGAVHGQYVQK